MGEKLRIIDSVNRAARRASPGSFWELYSLLLVRVFGEIIAEDKLLEECYCPIRSRDFDEQFIASITTGMPGALLCPGGIDPSDFFSEKLQSLQVGGYPFLVLGDVGAGKSTYIHHYFRVELKKIGLEEHLEGIIIDLREIGDECSDIFSFVVDKLNRYLTEKQPDISVPDLKLALEIFSKEISCFGKLYDDLERIDGKEIAEREKLGDIRDLIRDTHTFNTARIRAIKDRQMKAVFLILDNVDHFSRQFQERTFGVASRLMVEYNCPIIITTRLYTMPLALRHSWLSAYQPRFLRLSAPKTSEMVKKRIAYVLDNKEVEDIFERIGERAILVRLPSGYKFRFALDDVKNTLDTILDSLLTVEVIELLENISGGDLRFLLSMVRVALSSGYLYPEERRKRYKQIRYYDFLRAIMMGNNQYYFSDDPSIILNLFENEDKNDAGNNLVRIRTLQGVEMYSHDVYVPELLNNLREIGYSTEKVLEVLDIFLKSGLIESSYFEGTDIENVRKVRLTYSGRFYLQSLLKDINYIEHIKHSTYMDSEEEQFMEDLMRGGKSTEERIRSRFDATEVFIDYINKLEKQEEDRLQQSEESSIDTYDRFAKVYPQVKSSFLKAKEKILEKKESV